MANLGAMVIQGAQQQAQNDHTVGDAMQAFHVAATAEHARQELDMQKQQADINKANWVTQQYDKIGRTTGPAQGLLIDAFGRQAQQIIPGFNPDTLEVLKKDPDALRTMSFRAAHSLSRGGVQSPEQANALLALHNGDLEAFTKSVTTMGEQQAQVQAAQLKGEGMLGRVGAMQDNGTQAAFDKFSKDTVLPKLETLGRKLDRDGLVLKQVDPKHPVTYQTVHEVLMNIATVLSDGQLSDTRVASITPKIGDEVLTKLKTFGSDDPNQPAKPQLLEYAKHLVGRLNGAIGGDVSSRARVIGSQRGPEYFHNPNIAKAHDSMLKFYGTNQWRSDYANSEPQPQAAAPAPAPKQEAPNYGSTPQEIEKNYKIFQAQQAHQKAGVK